MRSFANARTFHAGGAPNPDLAWLAGLLEAEGTFLRPPPSRPRQPIVACRMTDRDVIERVASLFGAGVDRYRRRPFQVQYGTKLTGTRALMLMMDLKPIMGQRRTAAIATAADACSLPDRKLDFEAAEEIRDLHALGSSVSWLARSFDVARSTISQILSESVYSAPVATPWRSARAAGYARQAAAPDMSPCEFYWLVGWLEGEGSFIDPPPSDPKRPRISAETRDWDVAREVGRLLRVTPTFSYSALARRRGWSPTWKILRRGKSAVALMQALHPLMGSRRQSQIESALAAVGERPIMEAAGSAPASAVA